MIHSSTPLLALLGSVKQAGFLETYFYHPQLIMAGDVIIDRIDFEYLVLQAYVKETGSDSFGKQYSLTSRAEQILSDSIYSASQEEKFFAVN